MLHLSSEFRSFCFNYCSETSSSLAVRRADDDCSMLRSSNHGPPDRPFSSSSLPSIKTNVPTLQVPLNNIFKSDLGFLLWVQYIKAASPSLLICLHVYLWFTCTTYGSFHIICVNIYGKPQSNNSISYAKIYSCF